VNINFYLVLCYISKVDMFCSQIICWALILRFNFDSEFFFALYSGSICKTLFLDFLHRLYFNKITTFRKLEFLPSSGKMEGV
jgi:hypothetical protein